MKIGAGSESIELRKNNTNEDFDIFLDVLSNELSDAAENVQLVIFNLDGWCKQNSRFFPYMQSAIKSSKFPEIIRSATLLDFTKALNSGVHCFRLDDHLNSIGHEVVADHISSVLEN